MVGLFAAVVRDMAGGEASVVTAETSGNCWRKFASKSSAGFCVLVLEKARRVSARALLQEGRVRKRQGTQVGETIELAPSVKRWAQSSATSHLGPLLTSGETW